MRIRPLLFIAALVLLASACRDRDGTDAGTPPPGDGGGGGAENTAALCADMVDNDDNGFTDCGDRGCCGVVSCPPESFCGMNPDAGTCATGPENTMEACSDGCDNDGNMFFDCRDFSCSAFCGTENSNRTCIDGEDNDGDGAMDCMDSDCQDEAIVVCDGTTATGVAAAMWPAMVTTRCTNGTDDDGDSRFDCGEFSCMWNHPGCVSPTRENTNTLCANGVDDDQDGLTDCDDPGCDSEGLVVCMGTTPTGVAAADYGAMSNAECMGGADDDMDGFTDCMDFSCNQNPDVTICPGENNDAACSDMMDNDMNSFTDCADFSCSQNPFVTVCVTERTFAECSDGMDNNGNGFADCRDNACMMNLACFNASTTP